MNPVRNIIYHFHANFERQLKFARLELSGKNFTFIRIRRYNTKFCDPNETAIIWVDITSEWYEDPMVYRVLTCIFLF